MDNNFTETISSQQYWTQQQKETVALVLMFIMMTSACALLMVLVTLLLWERSSICRRFTAVEEQINRLTTKVDAFPDDVTRRCNNHTSKTEDSLSHSNMLWIKYRLIEMQKCFDSVAKNTYADRVSVLLMGAKGDTPHERLRNAVCGQYELPQADPEILRQMLGMPVPVGFVLNDKKLDKFIGTYLPGVRKDGHERFRRLLQKRVR